MKYIIFAVCLNFFTNFSFQIYFSGAENRHKIKKTESCGNSLKLDLRE